MPKVRLGPFARRVATVAGGTAIGQAVLVLASPIVTRLYAPGEFGVLASYLAIIDVIGVVAAWRYSSAIALPDDESDAAALLGVSLLATTLTAIACTVGLAATGHHIISLLDSPGLLGVLWTVPIAVLLLGAQQSLGTWLVRHRAYRRLGTGKAAEGTGKAVLQVGLGLGVGGGASLLLADLAARTLGAAFLLEHARTAFRRLRTLPLETWRRVALRYRDFPLFGAPAVLLNAAGLQAPALLFAACYGLEVAGLFALGQRIVAMPTALVGQAASQVYLGEGARLARENPDGLRKLYARTTVRLVLLGAVPLALCGVFAPWLFSIVFGSAWVEAGHYVRILAIAFAVQFVVIPLSHTLSILEKQRWQLGWDAARLVLVTGAIAGSALMRLPVTGAVWALATAATVAYLALHGLGWLAVCRCCRATRAL
jgi:O-antigen/teichoic acid export membrane protein